MKIFKRIVYFILSVQEKILTQRLNRTIGVKTASKHKKYYAGGCLVTLDSLAVAEKQKM